MEQSAQRPESFDAFVGQARAVENMRVFVSAARGRGEALDHVLLSGPPGTGKTTLARILAAELGVELHTTAGPVITRQGDLAAVLTALPPKAVLFIDEIHRLQASVEEILYSALEDARLDILLGTGPSASTMRIALRPFTLVGATTRSGLVSRPLRERFGIPVRLDFYPPHELARIIERRAEALEFPLSAEARDEIASRARGTPRIAVHLLRRVRDFAGEGGSVPMTRAATADALAQLEVDALGLNALDRRYLAFIAEHYEGGPVGIETLAAALSESRDTLEDGVEPFLLRLGLLQRTRSGRVLAPAAFKLQGLPVPPHIEAVGEDDDDTPAPEVPPRV